MTRILDLTMTLGDPRQQAHKAIKVPPVDVEPIHLHPRDGRSNSKITFWTHAGTHIDPPFHFVANGQTIDKLPLERLLGTALRIDLRPIVRERSPITASQIEELGYRMSDAADTIAVLQSGWLERKFGTPEYSVDYPWYDVSVAQWLVEAGAKAVAVDTYIDHVDAPTPGDCPCHRTLLGNGVPIIENLLNLEKISAREFRMYALPIKLHNGDGGQARVIAILED